MDSRVLLFTPFDSLHEACKQIYLGPHKLTERDNQVQGNFLANSICLHHVMHLLQFQGMRDRK